MRQLIVLGLWAGWLLQAGEVTVLALADLPGGTSWQNVPLSYRMEDGRLTIVAGPSTDWYISPADGKSSSNAPLLLFRPAEDFVLSARLNVRFETKWDAGFLMVYGDDRHWAKFALEMSVYGEPTIVTVVTRGVSDDCNSSAVSGGSVWYRIAKTGRAIGFYGSPDGHSWKMVRAFTMSRSGDLLVGFGSQSPAGEKGSAVFSDITYSTRRVRDIFRGE